MRRRRRSRRSRPDCRPLPNPERPPALRAERDLLLAGVVDSPRVHHVVALLQARTQLEAPLRRAVRDEERARPPAAVRAAEALAAPPQLTAVAAALAHHGDL